MLKTVITVAAILGLATPAFASSIHDLGTSRPGAVEMAKKKVKKEEKKEETKDESGKTEEHTEKTEKKEPQR